jgi:hypothetical protein
MKNHMILLLFFILFSSSVSSYTFNETVFDSEVEDLEEFEIEDLEFEIQYSDNNDVAIIRFDGFSLPVDREDCEPKDFLLFCFRNITYYLDGDPVPADVHDDDVEIYIDLLVNASLGKLDIERGLDKGRAYPSELVEYEIVFENRGEIGITAVEYEEEIDKEFEIVFSSGSCTLDGNDIMFTKDLAPGESETCRFRFRTDEPAAYGFSGSYEYYDGIKEVSSDTSTLELEVPDPLVGLDVELSEKRLDLGQETVLDIILSNLHNETLRIDQMQIDLPQQLEVVGKSASLSDDLSWEGYLKTDLNNTYTVTLMGVWTGAGEIEVSVDYEISDVINTVSDSLKVTLESDMDLEMTNSMIPSIVDEGDPVSINFTLFNPSTALELKDLNFHIKTDIPDLVFEKRVYKTLGKRNRKELNEGFIAQPSGSYWLNITLGYKSSYGEPFQKVEPHKVSIIGSSQPTPTPATASTIVTATPAASHSPDENSTSTAKNTTEEVPGQTPHQETVFDRWINNHLAFLGVTFIVLAMIIFMLIMKFTRKERMEIIRR